MDHFVLTLIIGGIEACIIPWCVWITKRSFNQERDLALQQMSQSNITSRFDKTDAELSKRFDRMDNELKEIREDFKEGIKDIVEKIESKN